MAKCIHVHVCVCVRGEGSMTANVLLSRKRSKKYEPLKKYVGDSMEYYEQVLMVKERAK